MQISSEKVVVGMRSQLHCGAFRQESLQTHHLIADCLCCMQELPCGHFMHSHCFAQYTRYNYTCPVCSKSMGDMSIYFGMLDSIVARDLADLPAAYRIRQQV